MNTKAINLMKLAEAHKKGESAFELNNRIEELKDMVEEMKNKEKEVEEIEVTVEII
jgi:hypothetical protein